MVVSETPSPSPTPTALSDDELLAMIPEGARAENFGSAVNFSRFFMLEYQRMFDEKDSSLFSFLSEPECVFCESSLSEFADLIGKEGRREGGAIVISDDSAQGGLRGDGFWYVGFLLSVAENRDYDADGTLVEMESGGAGDVALKLTWRDDHWQVVGVNVTLAPTD